MEQLLLVIHLIVAFLIIGLVLLQQGKGADVGASFGGNASQSVFGSQGSATFFSRSTAWLTAIFFMTNIGMVHLEHRLRKPYEPLSSVSTSPTSGGNITADDVPIVPGGSVLTE